MNLFLKDSKILFNSFRNKQILKNCLTKRYLMSEVMIGSTARLTKTFTEEDVKTFGELSGDMNPMHFDDKYCSETKFGKPVVHGMLTNGLVSAVLGTVLPGAGSVIVEMSMNFTKPLYIGEEVSAEVTIVAIKKKFIDCKYICSTPEGKEVINGFAKLVMF